MTDVVAFTISMKKPEISLPFVIKATYESALSITGTENIGSGYDDVFR